MSKKMIQKYMILERYTHREDWSIGFAADVFDTVEAAMDAIHEVVGEDPNNYADLEFKIAAINEQVITVRNYTKYEIHVNKQE